jgi:hypothetical protein
MPGKNPAKILQIRISLDGTEPVVWRQLLISEKASLLDLHESIQAVMPWQDYHLHEFIIRAIHYGNPQVDENHELDLHDEIDFSISSLSLAEGDSFHYTYDIGDRWSHSLKVEKITSATRGKHLPQCIGGQHACPPEDIEGAGMIVSSIDFADRLIASCGWIWDDEGADQNTASARAAIDDMVITPLESLGVLITRRALGPQSRIDPFTKAQAFQLTDFGQALIQTV